MENGANIGRINELAILERLFNEHLDGIFLIEYPSGNIIKLSDKISGNFTNVLKFDGTPYDEQINDLIDATVPDVDKDSIKHSMALSTIVDNLEKRKVYSVDFNSIDSNNNYVFRRILNEYLDEKKDIIVVLAENISSLVMGKTDPLTGGYNSTGFYNRVTEWLAANPGRKYRVHRYNIDRFRDINGVYGQNFGDKLLRNISVYMRRLDSDDSFSAHLNADHFVRFCADELMPAQECYDNFVESFSNYHISIPLKLHVGVYDLCEEGIDPFTMSYKALLALQTVKGDMHNKIAYYESGMLRREQEQLEFLNEIDDALENDCFEVWFQPQVDYEKKQIFGAESLIRWRHPIKGLLSPMTFIPLLEKSNYISKVDKYLIEKVCKYMRRWIDALPDKKIQISVNLSRLDIIDSDFVNSLSQIVKSYGIPHSALHLEVTESAYMKDAELLITEVDKLRNQGFSVEIDDFGAGYSSLNTLKDMNVDKLKLDMKFLSGGHGDKKEKIIIAAVIDMSHTLGLPIIAEGVETKEQADMLLKFGCKQMQGFYFSKPLPVEEYEALLYGKTKLPNLK